MLAVFARHFKSLPSRAGFHAGLTTLLMMAGAGTVHDATALGDSRTLSFHHTHSGEDLTVTFKRSGRYDDDGMKRINHFLRDWRSQDQTTMDRRLFDILWEVYRDVDGKQPIQIISAYRSPATNAMLRRRSSGVARSSQHMLGHAMDFFIPGVPLDQIRNAGLRLQRGGVGFYPTSGSPFVHLDTGNIRHWPRMTHDQLARVFPNGRTVHVPSDGNPLPGYQVAMAEIEKRGDGDDAALAKNKPGLFTALFKGKAANDDDDEGAAPAVAPAKPSAVGLMAAAMPAKSTEPVPMPRAKPAQAASFQVASADVKSLPTPPAPVVAPKMASDGNPLPRPPGDLAGSRPQSPADIINARGFWDEMPAAPKQAAPQLVAALSARQALSNAVDPQAPNDAADKTSAFAKAMAYAPAATSPVERPQVVTASAPMPRGMRPASVARNPMALNNVTTVVGKNMPAQGRVVAVSTRLAAAAIPENNVWMRAMIIAPSASTSMSATVMGGSDLTMLRPHFVKPQMVVAMGFSEDPLMGLICERFTGSISATLTTTAFTRTASLR
ncbi:DUF882 domain-containing protein [Tardiphaga sp.]|uniref:DUF882 domain-containing protein n=1 Tax=Tardiphaga sp. TaxID=1926292 RepID=UPI002625DF06|nr:DUF882 domain-containing protein [Tardiphaga sp.]MDB5616316.1 hypothetical protein [Tardiphaga sp.]